MQTDAAILIAALAVGAILATPRLARSPMWRATVTPLASIIGSGFLVLGPILNDSYGGWAPLVMIALCAAAWAFGAAIRFNMADGAEDRATLSPVERMIDTAADWALAGAYVISVSYYLNLFGGFALRLTPWAGAVPSHMVTTAAYLVILGVGLTHGFRWLERMEYGPVTLNLSIIAGLLVGLAIFAAGKLGAGQLVVNPPTRTGWSGLSLAFGLIVIVQGFETSRYLGASYTREVRLRSMRHAQAVATAVYVAYVLLLAYAFRAGSVPLTETAIIGLMQQVSALLPVLLVVAALSAQFSAAIADTGGAGGLIAALTAGKVTPRKGYALLGGLGIALTWSADIFRIINYASRAFAAYYALQAVIAAMRAWKRGARGKAVAFGALAMLGAAMVLFGAAAEGA